jgi:hypothetical protein
MRAGRRRSESALAFSLLCLLSIGAYAEAKAPAAAPAAASNLKEASALLEAAATDKERMALLDSLTTSLPPADLASLLASGAASLAPEQRSPYLVRSGDLDLLLGLFGDAQARYEEAAALAPGGRDGPLLLKAARCALAAGDQAKAAALAAELLADTSDPKLANAARLVGAWVLAIQGSSAAAGAEALALAQEGSLPKELKREARFIQWLCAEEGKSKSQAAALIAAEYPQSPEAAIASGAAFPPPLPHWYLGGLAASASREKKSAAPAAASPQAAAPVSEAPSSSPAQGAKGRRLQVGYFTVEENAKALRDELSGKGFASAVEELSRKAKAGDAQVKRWIVAVDGGKDLAKTMQSLKDSGYESYVIE